VSLEEGLVNTHREEGHIKIEENIGVLLPQPIECQEPSEAGRGQEGLFPRAFKGSQYFYFGLPASQIWRK
jgi:hypothetical protein